MSVDLVYDTDRFETLAVLGPLNTTQTSSVNREVAAMTHTQVPGIAAQPAPFINERENERALELIENAEREAPFCLCGRHMITIADGDAIVLECSSRAEEKSGLSAILARVTALGHTRRMIMEAPSA